MGERVVPIGRRWQPGQSGNPGGRRRSLAGTIRRRTRDGRKLVDLLLAIADDVNAAPRERITATRTLLEYGFSKPSPALEEQNDAVADVMRELWGKPSDPAKVYDV